MSLALRYSGVGYGGRSVMAIMRALRNCRFSRSRRPGLRIPRKTRELDSPIAFSVFEFGY
jgi:hypothetical protein